MTERSRAREAVARTAGVPLAQRIFAGHGEMAERVRNRDWSKTPLGPIETWPQSLRTALSICLGSRHPIVLWWGPERWMFYNDAYRPMLGERKHPQFLGASGQACWAEIWDVIGPMMDQVIATGEATWSEDLCLLMQRYGYLEETFFTFSYSPIRDDEGEPNGVFNACSETTVRVLAERRMRTLREMSVEARTVEEGARRCASVLGRNALDIPFTLVYLADAAGRSLHLTGHAGLAPGTAASPTTVELAHADGPGWPLWRVMTSGRPELVQGVAARFDGLPTAPWDEAPGQAMLLPIARAGGAEPAGVVVLGISPRRAFDDDYRGFFDLVAGHVATVLSNARAFEEQRDRADKLAALDRAKTDFFSNVSHEFRTPLTLILGPLEDALGDRARTLSRADLESVHRSALRLLRLVNSVLDFSRIEAERFHSSFEPIDLAVLTGGLAGSFQSLLESAGLTLTVDCPPLSEPVYVDTTQWEKIVLNLVSNAFKFTFSGHIVVRLSEHEDHVELRVTDTGTGIPADELPRIFERFHRVEGARGRSFEGTGIGLALVKELVSHHGGAVRAESVLGEGSTFVVTLPRGGGHLPQDRIVAGREAVPSAEGATPYRLEASRWSRPLSQNADPAPTTAPAAATHDSAYVLIADDNADMREYLIRLLSAMWTVKAVEDGQAALEEALRQPPDLVLSDIMMPRLDGVQLLRALRADSRTATTPVVLLSARVGEEAVVAGLETGADDYLVKPFSGRELLSRVGTHLEMARVRRTAVAAARELAETRAALLADLERKNKELEAFSYSVSHDLRAPLRSIDGFSQAILDDHGEELPGPAREYLARVRAAAQRMAELIDDLLTLSRVERAEFRRATVDISALARRVGGLLHRAAADQRMTFVVREGLFADADERLVEILLENVLGNAWKFTSKVAEPRVEVDAVEIDGQTAFSVADNGAGFDESYVQRLFIPFQRLHQESDFPGTGVGLATVKRIVERHGGRVWAEGRTGGGATIYWTLPSVDPRPGA